MLIERAIEIVSQYYSLEKGDHFTQALNDGSRGPPIEVSRVVQTEDDRTLESAPGGQWSLWNFIMSDCRRYVAEMCQAGELFDSTQIGDRIFAVHPTHGIKEFAIFETTSVALGDGKGFVRGQVTLKSFVGNCSISTQTLNRAEFIAKGFTAVRPRTPLEREQEARIDQLQADVETLTVGHDGLTKLLGEAKRERDDAVRQMKETTSNIKSLFVNIRSLKAEVAGLESLLDEFNSGTKVP